MTPRTRRAASLALLASLALTLTFCKILPLKFKRWVSLRLMALHSRALMRLLNMRVKLLGELPKVPVLIVANHLSYLDIAIMSSLFHATFVTSEEMAEAFVLGALVKLTDCLTVDRRRFTTLLHDIKEMCLRLGEGESMVLFPEATTSNGNILPFKSSLLATARHAGVPIQPVVIRYLDLTLETKDSIFYYGNMEFFKHVGAMTKRDRIDVEVELLPLVNSDRCRKELRDELHSLIKAKTLLY